MTAIEKETFMEKSFFALGTVNVIRAYACKDEGILGKAIDRVFDIHKQMSVFHEGSDVANINKNAGMGFTAVHPDTFSLLEKALDFSGISCGAFDITLRPLTSLWAIGKQGSAVPDENRIFEALSKTGYHNLLLNKKNHSVSLLSPGQSIDLGGIAKGYAGDEIERILQKEGIKNALINLGGNVVAMGCRPDKTPFRIGIQNPLSERGETLGSIDVSNTSVVTSGSNERFFIQNGTRYHHIISPYTGKPVQNNLLSVTVLCPSGTDADALSTALFVLGPKDSLPLLKKRKAHAIFIFEDLSLCITRGIGSRFKQNTNIC